jgi:hypothetical protein
METGKNLLLESYRNETYSRRISHDRIEKKLKRADKDFCPAP